MITLEPASLKAYVADPVYRSFEHLRTEALMEAVLQPTVHVGV